ncbi:nucleotide pyrophosphohydrolase [Collinsella sp. AGMB00827]|uniref:Nucleotide pyrophosphohydrolase n=1 Tax=Collinsella ureilytica TaxID=2869515 RepID=A0ABS7MLJ0_9ACTN|nr:nucleotide pyrophosphohydrolase [Collinsella urealyticum]MBY4798229.1 nucleotide pyrophosphohydrolase [Collinsella urealyticum]
MSFEEEQQRILAFAQDRDWQQFHNSKDLALSISIEAAELLELFQWSGEVCEAEGKLQRVQEELADVLIYCIFLADHLGIDIDHMLANKMDKNARNYPIDKAKGRSTKYTELD